MNATRARAVALVRAYVPSDTGDPHFAEITGGDYAGIGTTCGFLPSWLFHTMGCNDGRVINRTDPAHGLRYTVGANIDRLVNGAKTLGAARTLATGLPEPGDAVFYSNGPSSTEHVAIVLDATTNPAIWQTADAGIRNSQGYQCARLVARAVDVKTGRATFADGPRQVREIINLERVVPAASDDGPSWLAGVGLAAWLAWRLIASKAGA